MKILFVIPAPFPADRGSPARVLEMCKALAPRGIECHVLCYGGGQDLRDVPATVHRLPRWRFYRGKGPAFGRLPLSILLAGRTLGKQITGGFDVVHCHMHEAGFAGLPGRLLGRKPLVLDIHSGFADEVVEQGFARENGWLWRIASWIDRHLPRWVDARVCVSAQVEQRYRALLPGHPFHVVPNPTDLDHFRPRPSSLRGELGIGDGPVVGYQGNLEPMQRLDLLLEAVPAIRAEVPDVRFVIGYTTEPSSLEESVIEKGFGDVFHFIPAPYHIAPDVANCFDVAVIPRLEQTAPMKLSNLLACGRPVVVNEAIAHSLSASPRDCGMFPFSGPAMLSQAVIEALDESSGDRGSFGSARAFAEREFSREAAADRLLTVYRLAGARL